MELHILPLDSVYTWTIFYGEDDKREYLLKTVDAEKGWYQIDEQNTIALDAILIHGKLYSRFEVMGTLLLSMVELVGEELHYEIISGKTEPLTINGEAMHEGEEIPEVKAFPVGARHVAVLRRVD